MIVRVVVPAQASPEITCPDDLSEEKKEDKERKRGKGRRMRVGNGSIIIVKTKIACVRIFNLVDLEKDKLT